MKADYKKTFKESVSNVKEQLNKNLDSMQSYGKSTSEDEVIESFANAMIINNDLKRTQGFSQFFTILLIVILFIIGVVYYRRM